MQQNNLEKIWANSLLDPDNSSYLEELYDIYLSDPSALPTNWRTYFDNLAPKPSQTEISHTLIQEQFRQLARQPRSSSKGTVSEAHLEFERKESRVAALINAYRVYGHRQAQLDPLKLVQPERVEALELNYHGLSADDLKVRFHAANLLGMKSATLEEVVNALRETYCRTLGFEYMHMTNTEEVVWFQKRIESTHAKVQLTNLDKKQILKSLTAAEGLEKYLGEKYVGQKRFSLEGGDSLIPMLHELIRRASSQNVEECVFGMAHRGRLNVLVNVVGKSPRDLFNQFEGKLTDKEKSGDVKYHQGFSANVSTPGGTVHLALAFNPSHLEIVNPVVAGSVRLRQKRRNDMKGDQVLPVLIHGDAAFTGQGVVMETFNFSQTRGFYIGGTLHIVINNQVGFTTSNPHDARSTLYCTDVAKMVEAPVIHVNGDDPEAAILAVQLALDYRMQFNKDIVVDLVCYRKHGHNEADEPSATQPVMYAEIKQHLTPRALYAKQLLDANEITTEEVDNLSQSYRTQLTNEGSVVEIINEPLNHQVVANWEPYLKGSLAEKTDTSVDIKRLKKLAQAIEKLPESFLLQPQVGKMMQERGRMTTGEVPLNWGYAETLAYATLLDEGYPVRLCGQDSGRGTFSHRHAVLYNQQNGEAYVPLNHLKENQAQFEVIDSVLSEEAVVGFEYGYAITDPQNLVIWEAQFGDFANGAQVVIDQFISSGEQKWGRLCGLTLFLPHGYEGMGPEHSSARLERFLQLCAQQNMQVCVPTTPAQIFHLLRRQMLRSVRKPLIVMTPKSLLRHKLAVSSLEDLEKGEFHLVIPEIDSLAAAKVKRVVICSGKVYYDLLEQRRANSQEEVAIIRVEQLYPFPKEELLAVLNQYSKAKELVWCQEEPQNQGAWYQINHHLQVCLTSGQQLKYAGRAASAATAAGYTSQHTAEQKALLEQALSLTETVAVK